MSLSNPTPWMDDAGPLTAEGADWPYACEPPSDDTEADIYGRTGIRGLIEWRADRTLSAAIRIKRESGTK